MELLFIGFVFIVFFAGPITGAYHAFKWFHRCREAGKRGRQAVALALVGLCALGILVTVAAIRLIKGPYHDGSGEFTLIMITFAPFPICTTFDVVRAFLRKPPALVDPRDRTTGAHKRCHIKPSLGWVAGMIAGGIVSSYLVIALPCLLPARLHANETSAMASLRAYLNAQGTFHRQDWDGDGVNEYAADYPDLFELVDVDGETQEPHLIDRALAEATSPETPRSGYYFVDITADVNGPYDCTRQFGLCAVPAEYRRTGRSTFIVNNEGVVYFRENAGKPVTAWPDIEAEGWFPVTE